jgi:hypothetical protein
VVGFGLAGSTTNQSHRQETFMFEDQTVELLPARTVMGSHHGGGSRSSGGRGGNGGSGGSFNTAFGGFNDAFINLGSQNANASAGNGGNGGNG